VVTAFPKRKTFFRQISLGVLLEKINLGEWLSSLFLVKDVSQMVPTRGTKKGKLIAMPPRGFRLRKSQPSIGERSGDEAVLRSL